MSGNVGDSVVIALVYQLKDVGSNPTANILSTCSVVRVMEISFSHELFVNAQTMPATNT